MRPIVYRPSVIDYVPAGLITMANRSLTEGDSGTTNMTFTPTLGVAQTRDIKIPYRTVAGTATADVDYVSKSSVATITAGQTTTTIDIQIIGDTDVESDEAFNLQLIEPYFVG